jgi:hypothetical protein
MMKRLVVWFGIAALSTGCAMFKPGFTATNASKCQGVGGVYQPQTSACQFRTPDVSTWTKQCASIDGTYKPEGNICQMPIEGSPR